MCWLVPVILITIPQPLFRPWDAVVITKVIKGHSKALAIYSINYYTAIDQHAIFGVEDETEVLFRFLSAKSFIVSRIDGLLA